MTLLFNPAVRHLAAPPIPEVQGWARAYDGRHGPLLDFSQAVPGYPPHADLLAWLGEASASPAYTGYGDIEGEAVLREAYAAHVSGLYGSAVAASEIQITSGCNQAFFATMLALAAPGDEVILVRPFYFNHEMTLDMLGIAVRAVDAKAADGFVPSPDAVAAAIGERTRAVVLVSPNNPTGAVYPEPVLQAIFEICRARGIWLIVDETYRDFLADGASAPHRLFANPGWQDSFIQLYSFSKSFCIPGHRLGAIAAGAAVGGSDRKDHGQSADLRAAAGPACACQGHSCPGRLAQREPRGNGAASGRVPFSARQFALAYRSARRLFRICPPSVCGRQRRCRRRAAGKRIRRDHAAGLLFRKRTGAIPAPGIRQCRRSHDRSFGDAVAVEARNNPIPSRFNRLTGRASGAVACFCPLTMFVREHSDFMMDGLFIADLPLRSC